MILREKKRKNINFNFFFVSKHGEYIMNQVYLKIISKKSKNNKITKIKIKKDDKIHLLFNLRRIFIK